jgi:hypothetical protein
MKSKKRTPKPFLNRYTTLPVLLDMLAHKKILLLNPTTWEDRNDSHYLERYKADKKLKTLLALCFSIKRETFHHWKIFASGSAGVCVEFDKEQLLNPITAQPGFRLSKVDYLYIKEVKKSRPAVENWPFIKRKPFKDEGEFRIIYESKTAEEPTKEVSIQVNCIRKVTLSPWMPTSVASTVKTIISQIDGCEKLKVKPSSLLETNEWKAAIKSESSTNK